MGKVLWRGCQCVGRKDFQPDKGTIKQAGRLARLRFSLSGFQKQGFREGDPAGINFGNDLGDLRVIARPIPNCRFARMAAVGGFWQRGGVPGKGEEFFNRMICARFDMGDNIGGCGLLPMGDHGGFVIVYIFEMPVKRAFTYVKGFGEWLGFKRLRARFGERQESGL